MGKFALFVLVAFVCMALGVVLDILIGYKSDANTVRTMVHQMWTMATGAVILTVFQRFRWV
jgi:hypothetical protein